MISEVGLHGFGKRLYSLLEGRRLPTVLEVCGRRESHTRCALPAEKVEMFSFVPVISAQ